MRPIVTDVVVVCLSVCLCVCKLDKLVSAAKTAEPIWMPFVTMTQVSWS